MRNAVWPEAINSSADAERAEQYYQQLKGTKAGDLLRTASAEQAQILAALFSGSRALSELLIAKPTLVTDLDPEKLKSPRQLQGLWREVNKWLPDALAKRDYAPACRSIREFKQRETLRIVARDLARLGTLQETIDELSNMADVCLETIFQITWQQLTER